MIVEFRKVTRAGNNINAQLYFDHVIVAPTFNCTPKEFEDFVRRLNEGSAYTGDEGVIVTET